MDQQRSVEKGRTSRATRWMTALVGGIRYLCRWAQVHGGLGERCRPGKGSSRVLWGELSVGRNNKTRALLRLFCIGNFRENSERKYPIQGHETSIISYIFGRLERSFRLPFFWRETSKDKVRCFVEGKFIVSFKVLLDNSSTFPDIVV